MLCPRIAQLFFIRSCSSTSRVVITGLGIVCPLGTGVGHVWRNLLDGKIGTSQLNGAEYENIPCQVAAFVPRGTNAGELDLNKEFGASDAKKLSLSTKYGLIAAKEALEDANWFPDSESDQEKTGVAVGTGMVDLSEIVNEGSVLKNKGYGKVSPHFVTKILTNMTAGHISIKYGFKGPNHSVSTACATGAHAIGDAYNFIKHGHAAVMVCGASDAVISPLSIAAFSRIRALSTNFNHSPSEASRPFDKLRDGFVMGEGAGILVLECLNHALARNAKIYAEIISYGLSGDAHHIASPSKDGLGAYLCMKSALQKSGVSELGYINAHATSTPLGDAVELAAIQKLFQNDISNIYISSTKGATGHLLGSAGSIEAIFAILACQTGCIPPTVNLDNCDFDTNLKIIAKCSSDWPENRKSKRIALTNSFGFGGTNASLIFSRYEQ